PSFTLVVGADHYHDRSPERAAPRAAASWARTTPATTRAPPASWPGVRGWPSSSQANPAANTGSEVAAIPAVAALITRTAPTARANGSRVPSSPTPRTAAATPGSARVRSGHDHQGTATAQMATATRNPHSRVVAGSRPRPPRDPPRGPPAPPPPPGPGCPCPPRQG